MLNGELTPRLEQYENHAGRFLVYWGLGLRGSDELVNNNHRGTFIQCILARRRAAVAASSCHVVSKPATPKTLSVMKRHVHARISR